jgi:hypothetical protein
MIPAEQAAGEATAELGGPGETDGGMSDRVRSFAAPSVDPMDCLSARRAVAGTARGAVLKPPVRRAHFSGQSWTRKKVIYPTGSTTSVKTATTNGERLDPRIAVALSVAARQPTRGFSPSASIHFGGGCQRRVCELVYRSLVHLFGGAGRRGNGSVNRACQFFAGRQRKRHDGIAAKAFWP